MMQFSSLNVLAVVLFSASMFIGLIYSASGQPAPCTNWKGLPDNDCDSLADVWETTGYDVDMDGTPDLDLKALGANPNHKDIFVELDYMQYHKPRTGVTPAVVTAFANAPVPNPDGLQGIKLHIIEDEQIPHQTSITMWSAFDTLKDTWFGTLSERQNNPKAVLAKDDTFHYILFIHQYNGGTSSGTSELPGDDVVVSLGGAGWGTYNGHTVGTVDEQKGTLMHELGHNLGLRHGGDVDENCKPNYLSVMSYSFQFPDYVSSRPLDYSRSQLGLLSEAAGLNEQTGISPASTPTTLKSVYGPTTPLVSNYLSSPTNPINWDRDGNPSETGITANINNLGSGSGCTSSTNTLLGGFNDWGNLKYWGTAAGGHGNGTSASSGNPDNRELVPEKTADHKKFIRNSMLDRLAGVVDPEPMKSKFSKPSPSSIKKPFLAADVTVIKNDLASDNLDGAIDKLIALKNKIALDVPSDQLNIQSSSKDKLQEKTLSSRPNVLQDKSLSLQTTSENDLASSIDNMIISLMKQK